MEILAQFRDTPDFAKPAAFAPHLKRLWIVIEALLHKDDRFAQWYLGAETEEKARLYRVFDSPGVPSAVLLDELSRQHEGEENFPKVIGLWNGRIDAISGGAKVELAFDTGSLPEEIEINLPKETNPLLRLGNYRALAEVVWVIVNAYRPAYVSVAPREYFFKKVFEDRPGVGWMLYLPHVLTLLDVPEARNLIPVEVEGKQKGTIIVSEIDEVFSADNPEHVKVANAIEVRLVNDDLLPRYIDL